MCEKLNHPLTTPRGYWKISNRLLSNKKFPAIPPLLVDGKIISNFSQKAAIFNKSFVSQYTRYKIKAGYQRVDLDLIRGFFL